MMTRTSTRMFSITSNLRARLIKFRYGSARDQQTSSMQQGGSQQVPSAPAHQGEAIWDFQIPAKWRRKPLDEQEIAVINNGGPL